jgi:hypothetical protein
LAVESNEVEEQFRPARSGPQIFHCLGPAV